MKGILISAILTFTIVSACSFESDKSTIIYGAQRTSDYLHRLGGKRIGVVANHTSLINKTHLVDSLMTLDVNVVRIFSPEHGFRGKADAGAHIEDGVDSSTGIEVISLYGSNRKPTKSQFGGIDILIFDIQDVGTRFYTYISTLEYVMEVAAELNIEVMILDRPNPNGHIIDGPVLDTAFKSFVGMQAIPVAHGMTVGEYASMLNGENMLSNKLKCKLTIIGCLNYSHNTPYILPVPPSPNLPNQNAVLLYPSLCFFEGTVFSCGRGTAKPFQIFGHPKYHNKEFSFTPVPGPGSANPKLNGMLCFGKDLSDAIDLDQVPTDRINLTWLIDAYRNFPEKDEFFINYFNTLAGTDILKKQIIDGLSEEEIRLSWQDDLNQFKEKRAKYLLY